MESEPLFSSVKYNLDHVTTHNAFSLAFEEFLPYLKQQFYLCPNCRVTATGQCNEKCTPFLEYEEYFVIYNDLAAFWIPPPKIFAKKNLSYFNSFVEMCDKEYNAYLNGGNGTQKQFDDLKAALVRKYEKFKDCSFKGGFLQKQTSGKYSYIRTNILGAQVNGIRGTLTVDPRLSANEIGIPRHLYESLHLAIPFVILNRDPSINSRSIYVCNVVPYDNDADHTIHLNEFVLIGLNADQDGDDINLYYVELESDDIAYELRESMHEIIRRTWKLGHRHDVYGNCRYSFGQYRQLMLHRHNDELCKLSPFWRSLQKFPNKPRLAMTLGCYTHRKELDEFLDVLNRFCQSTSAHMATYDELINGNGILFDTVASGAKGSVVHLDAYLDGFHRKSDESIFANSVKNFNKYVTSNSEMKIAGRQQFSLLHVYQNVFLCNNNIYICDTVLFKNVNHCPIFSHFIFNRSTVEYNLYSLCENLSV